MEIWTQPMRIHSLAQAARPQKAIHQWSNQVHQFLEYHTPGKRGAFAYVAGVVFTGGSIQMDFFLSEISFLQ